MRKLMLAAALSGAAMVGALSSASAQLAIETPAGGIYVGPNNYYDDYYYRPYGPRVYGYTYDDRGYGYNGHDYRQRREDYGRCGPNSHWDGQGCSAGVRP